METVKNNSHHFIEWAKINHGDHDNCDVAVALKKHKGDVDKILEAVVETEDRDWEESWTQYLHECEYRFWASMFKPRTKKYQRETLTRLRKGVSHFETPEQNAIKIEVLKDLLN